MHKTTAVIIAKNFFIIPSISALLTAHKRLCDKQRADTNRLVKPFRIACRLRALTVNNVITAHSFYKLPHACNNIASFYSKSNHKMHKYVYCKGCRYVWKKRHRPLKVSVFGNIPPVQLYREKQKDRQKREYQIVK